MTPAPQVVVVGDLMTDVVARLQNEVVIGSDAAAEVSMTGGGSGANVAAWLASTDTTVAFVGRIGADANGATRTEELAAEGVQVHVTADDHRPTGTVVVVVSPDGERTMFPDRGANLALQPDDVPTGAFAPGGHLHLSGYALLDPGPRDAAMHALALARRSNMTVSVDPSSVQPLRIAGAGRFLEWTRGVDYCLPNREEAAELVDTDDPGAAASRLATYYGQAVVTLGARGAVWSDGERTLHSPAAPAVVRDTTGAGDAFTAGFLAATVDARPIEACLRRGAELAALAVAVDGARPRP